MPLFNYDKISELSDNPIEGDLYYNKINYSLYIYKNNNWCNIDEYTKDFDVYDSKIERKKKLEALNKITE